MPSTQLAGSGRLIGHAGDPSESHASPATQSRSCQVPSRPRRRRRAPPEVQWHRGPEAQRRPPQWGMMRPWKGKKSAGHAKFPLFDACPSDPDTPEQQTSRPSQILSAPPFALFPSPSLHPSLQQPPNNPILCVRSARGRLPRVRLLFSSRRSLNQTPILRFWSRACVDYVASTPPPPPPTLET